MALAVPEETIPMTRPCEHLALVHEVTPSAGGCEDCLRTGDWWVHLRICMTCGHVGCCDSSPNRHATGHWHNNHKHPIVRSSNQKRTGGGATKTTSCSTSPAPTPHRHTTRRDR